MKIRLELEKFLPYRLVHLSQTVSKTFYATYPNEFNLSIPQWRVVALLGEKSPQAALELVARSGMDKVQVSRACDSLSKQGYLSRKVDLADRRKLKLELTRKGKRAQKKYTEMAVNWEQRLLKCLNEDEKKPFDQILNSIFENSVSEKNIDWESSEGDSEKNRRFSLARFYPYRFAVLGKLISENFAEVYHLRFGLTIPEWRLIAVLAQYGPISAQEASQFAGLDKVKVSRAIAALQEAKLIVRVVDPSDRRKVQLSLSAKGKRTYQSISKMALDWEKGVAKDLDESQLALLDRVINKVMKQTQVIFEENERGVHLN